MMLFCKPLVARPSYEADVQLILYLSIDDGECDTTIETRGIGPGPLPPEGAVSDALAGSKETLLPSLTPFAAVLPFTHGVVEDRGR